MRTHLFNRIGLIRVFFTFPTVQSRVGQNNTLDYMAIESAKKEKNNLKIKFLSNKYECHDQKNLNDSQYHLFSIQFKCPKNPKY